MCRDWLGIGFTHQFDVADFAPSINQNAIVGKKRSRLFANGAARLAQCAWESACLHK